MFCQTIYSKLCFDIVYRLLKAVIRIPEYIFSNTHLLCVLFSFQEARLNVEALSKREVLLLFSVLEGELEARDFVIQALKVSAVPLMQM